MKYLKKIEELLKIIKESNNIVFFGGAETSTETRFKYTQNKNRGLKWTLCQGHFKKES